MDSNKVAGIFNNISAGAPFGSFGRLEFGNTAVFCGPQLGLEADCLMCKGGLMCNMCLNLKARNLQKLELFGDGRGVACPQARVLTCCLSSPALPITTKIIAIAKGGKSKQPECLCVHRVKYIYLAKDLCPIVKYIYRAVLTQPRL
jgi:hypothetical protein